MVSTTGEEPVAAASTSTTSRDTESANETSSRGAEAVGDAIGSGFEPSSRDGGAVGATS